MGGVGVSASGDMTVGGDEGQVLRRPRVCGIRRAFRGGVHPWSASKAARTPLSTGWRSGERWEPSLAAPPARRMPQLLERHLDEVDHARMGVGERHRAPGYRQAPGVSHRHRRRSTSRRMPPNAGEAKACADPGSRAALRCSIGDALSRTARRRQCARTRDRRGSP